MDWKSYVNGWDYYAKLSAIGMAAIALCGGIGVWLLIGSWFSIFLGLVWFVFCGYHVGIYIENLWLDYKFKQTLDNFESGIREALKLKSDKPHDPTA